MRNWIDIISEAVFFTGPFKTGYGEVDIVILKNPTPREMRSLLGKSEYNELRGLLDDDLYIWDAALATHSDIANALKIDGSDLHITEDGVDVNDCPPDWTDEEATMTGQWIKNNSCLRAFYQGDYPITLTAPDSGEEWNF